MTTHAEYAAECRAVRREMVESREAIRRFELARPLQEMIADVFAGRTRRSGRTGTSRSALVRLERHDTDAEIKAKLAIVRSKFQKIPVVPEASEPAAARRIVRYWVGNSRFGALRETVIAEPPARDRWGRPIR